MKLALVLGALFWLALALVVFSGEAECSACIGQFCAFDVDCPQDCHCAVEMGKATGKCW
jgi:hypothetical protein